MGQIEDLRLFVTVVENGGIARAAAAMNIAKSAVSRRLSQMEERYGVRLIDRQPRVWEITTAGQELYQRAARMVADAEDLDHDFMHTSQSLAGPLAISVAREFGLTFLKSVLFEFAVDNPAIDLTIDFDDRTVDLDRENYDLAIRITDSVGDGLVTHHLGSSQHGLFACPSYLAERGTPKTIEDLSKHALLHYGTARRATWHFEQRRKTTALEFQPALNSNSGPFLLDAAERGLGIARLPDFLSDESKAAGRIVAVLPSFKIHEWGIHLIYSSNRRLNRRMRALIRVLEDKCAVLRC